MTGLQRKFWNFFKSAEYDPETARKTGLQMGLSHKEQEGALREGLAEINSTVEALRRKVDMLAELSGLFDSFRAINTCNHRSALEKLESTLPEMFNACYPRRFEIPSGFSSPKRFAEVALCAAWDASNWRKDSDYFRLNEKEWKENTIRNHDIIKTVSALTEKMVPTYFVSAAIMHALINTDLPKDFSLAEMPWPLDAMLFALPDRMLCASAPVTHLAIVRLTEREYPSYWIKWGKYTSFIEHEAVSHQGSDSAALLALCSNGSVVLWKCPLDSVSIYEAANTSVTKLDISDLGVAAQAVEGDELTFASRNLPQAAFQIILAMLACPEMIEAGVLVRHQSNKKGRIKKALWSPNFFGKAYLKYDVVVGDPGEASCRRPHWRRGHFRHQRYGPGNKAIRVLWIQPMLIGKDRLAA